MNKGLMNKGLMNKGLINRFTAVVFIDLFSGQNISSDEGCWYGDGAQGN